MDFRKEVLDKVGVDMQVISFTAPGTLIEAPDRSVELCKIVNNSYAQIQTDDPDRFATLGTLPLNKPEVCAHEFERAVVELGLKGITLFSNANGVPLSDSRFWPIYEIANDLKSVFFLHPTYPVGVEAMEQYMLMPLVGFLTDTTLATASLIFSGVVERFPNIRWVLGHLGGAIPYFAERLDRGYEAYDQCRENISRPPTEYLKENFYYDTVNFDVKALEFAISFAGVHHLVAGSDYPHQIGSIEKMLKSIEALNVSKEDKASILGGNTERLLGM
jgi:aminocarboxymuconate-semialdehyde decarboxylase